MDRAARTMLQAKLKNSKFGEEEFVELMVEEFEKKVCLSYSLVHLLIELSSYSIDQAYLRR